MIRSGVKQAFASQFKLDSAFDHSVHDLVTLYQVKGGLVAKVEVVTTGTVDTYTALRLTIISPKVGTLDEHVFKFDDYLSFDVGSVFGDLNPHYKGGFYAWAHGGEFDWYIAKPKSVERLTAAINAYIEHYVQE
jgi:hypothetical protein